METETNAVVTPTPAVALSDPEISLVLHLLEYTPGDSRDAIVMKHDLRTALLDAQVATPLALSKQQVAVILKMLDGTELGRMEVGCGSPKAMLEAKGWLLVKLAPWLVEPEAAQRRQGPPTLVR